MADGRRSPDPMHDRLVTWLADVYPPEGSANISAVHALRAALDVAQEAEHQALRWEDQLPVPMWIGELRQRVAAALGMTDAARAALARPTGERR